MTREDEGSFFVNGKIFDSDFSGASLVTGPSPPGRIMVNRYVCALSYSAGKRGLPVVMVQALLTPADGTKTTPDGREGWRLIRAQRTRFMSSISGPRPLGFDRDGNQSYARSSGRQPSTLPRY